MIEIVPAIGAHVEFMWNMLFYASHSHHEDGTTIADMKRNPDLIRHLDQWGSRPGDLGVVAHQHEQLVGACWIRHMIGAEQQDVTFVDEQTPELVIAVAPDLLAQGIGSQLLATVLEQADDRSVHQIVLTARASNPAVALYERSGFATTERITNRVGTESVKMVRVSPREQPEGK